jgi:hypothetical protein
VISLRVLGDIMPIRPSLRWFYPIDWPQISREIRFGRARGCCEVCSRRHNTKVLCLPDGRWFDRDEIWSGNVTRPAGHTLCGITIAGM